MTSWTTLSLEGRRAFKLVPGRFPPLRHFDRIAGARDLDVLEAVAAMTDDQARDEIGRTELVAPGERYHGNHAELLMAPFTTFDPAGSPFSDGSYGVCCLRLQEDAAIADARRGLGAFFSATQEKPIKLRLGLYSFALAGLAADLRATRADDVLAQSRELGPRLRAAGIAAALYPNAYDQGADGLAVFKPGALTRCIRNALVELSWNGKSIDTVSVMPSLEGVRELNAFNQRSETP